MKWHYTFYSYPKKNTLQLCRWATEGLVFIGSQNETEVIDSSCTNFTSRIKLTTKLEGDALSPLKTERCLSCAHKQEQISHYSQAQAPLTKHLGKTNKQIQSLRSGEMTLSRHQSKKPTVHKKCRRWGTASPSSATLDECGRVQKVWLALKWTDLSWLH